MSACVYRVPEQRAASRARLASQPMRYPASVRHFARAQIVVAEGQGREGRGLLCSSAGPSGASTFTNADCSGEHGSIHAEQHSVSSGRTLRLGGTR